MEKKPKNNDLNIGNCWRGQNYLPVYLVVERLRCTTGLK